MKDLEHVMKLIDVAKEWMKAKQLQQWDEDYPNIKVIEEDIKNKNSFVLEADGKIVASLAVVPSTDSTFYQFLKGECLTREENFGFATRAAMDASSKGKGIGELLVESFEEISKRRKYDRIKTITHESNKRMQKVLLKHGYNYCCETFISGMKMLAF